MIKVYRTILTLVFLDGSDEVTGCSCYSPVMKTEEAAANLGKKLLRYRQITSFVVCHSFDGIDWYRTAEPVGNHPKVIKFIPDMDLDVVHDPIAYIRREKYLYDLEQERQHAKDNQNVNQG